MIKSLSLFILLFCAFAFGQDEPRIISSDGKDLGPRSEFLKECSVGLLGDKDESEMYFDINPFCECLADNLLSKMTKEGMDYVFKQSHFEEIENNEVYADIVKLCALANLKRGVSSGPPPQEIQRQGPPPAEIMVVDDLPPPPQEAYPLNENRIAKIDSIIELADYEKFFDQIRNAKLEKLVDDGQYNKKEKKRTMHLIVFENFKQDWLYDYYGFDSDIELSREVIKMQSNTESNVSLDSQIFLGMKEYIDEKLTELRD